MIVDALTEAGLNAGDLIIALIVMMVGGAATVTVYLSKTNQGMATLSAAAAVTQATAISALESTVRAVQATNEELVRKIAGLQDELGGLRSELAASQQATHDGLKTIVALVAPEAA